MSRAVSNKSWGTLSTKWAHDVLNFKSRAEFDDYRHLGNVKSQADVQTFGQGDYVKMKELGFTTKGEFSTFQRMHFDAKAISTPSCAQARRRQR